MNIDIVFVTYNSEKWINKCLDSIKKSKYDLTKIGLYFFDCASKDNTVKLLEKFRIKNSNKFNEIKIIKSNKNIGFGRGNNKAFKYTKASYVFFLNIDCEIYPDTISKIESEILNKDENVGILELRQTPYEHPKYYNPYNGDTTWASGACFVISRNLFKKVNGFDRNIFLYCEDVELSFRIRKRGYKIKYVYDIPIKHYSYENGDFKLIQFIYSVTNNIYLRYKYGNIIDIIRGHRLFIKAYKNIDSMVELKEFNLVEIKKTILNNEIKMTCLGIISLISRIKYLFLKKYEFKPKFLELDYECSKLLPFYKTKTFDKNPLVSVIVRTHDRPESLRETLFSIRNQTYKNIEVIIVEDGKPKARKMVEEEFGDLNIKYFFTTNNVGVAKVANIGLKNAAGKYFNFLDDDDLFYPEHIEVLLSELIDSDYKIAYASAFETTIDVISYKPYNYKIKNVYIKYDNDFNLLYLLNKNMTPIQTVMFKREVYEKLGGVDEELQCLEDWDLWIRYSLKFPFKYIKRTTSLYRVPADYKIANSRKQKLASCSKNVKDKYLGLELSIKTSELEDFAQKLERDFYLERGGLIKRIANKFKRRK